MEDAKSMAEAVLEKDIQVLREEEKSWEAKRKELRERIEKDWAEVRQASVPEGYYLVKTVRLSINDPEDGADYLAVKNGTKPNFFVNPNYHTVDGVYDIPKNEIVYFWDSRKVAWRVLFQSDSPRGMYWTGASTGWVARD